jgi:hypothetical protein
MRKLILASSLAAVVVLSGLLYYETTPPQAQRSTSSQQSATVEAFLGYIPQGYHIVPRFPNAPLWPCPKGLNSTQCQVFQQTCGNGVCDPNERCDTCPVDCAPSGNQLCDPYTGRGSVTVGICQLNEPNALAGGR